MTQLLAGNRDRAATPKTPTKRSLRADVARNEG